MASTTAKDKTLVKVSFVSEKTSGSISTLKLIALLKYTYAPDNGIFMGLIEV